MVKIQLTSENTTFTRSVVVDDSTEKRIRIKLIYFRKSTWIKDTTVSSELVEGEDYVLTGTSSATAPGMYSARITGIGRYSGELTFEWELLARDDAKILESPYAAYFLGEKNKRELRVFDFNPLNMDEEEYCHLPTYERLLHDYAEREQPKKKHLVHYSVFRMPSSYHPYQDSAYPRDGGVFDLDENGVFRIALSDGVTGSYRSKIYADLLTERFCTSGRDLLWNGELQEVGKDWMKAVLQEVAETFPNSKEEMLKEERRKLRHRGASSTIAGLELYPDSWSTISTTIGDSVVFEIMRFEDEGTQIIRHTPNLTSKEFTNRPNQLHSSDLHCPDEYIKIGFGRISDIISREPTYFLIASDALAHYILSTPEDSISHVLDDLLSIKSNQDFQDYCQKQRDMGKLHDDDYTLCVIWVEADYFGIHPDKHDVLRDEEVFRP